jgi:hypothetical protein
MISLARKRSRAETDPYAWVGSPFAHKGCACAHSTYVSGLISRHACGSAQAAMTRGKRDRDGKWPACLMRHYATSSETRVRTLKRHDAAEVSFDGVSPCWLLSPPDLARRPLCSQIKHSADLWSMRKCKAISNSNCKLGCALEGPPSACGFGTWARASLLATNWRSQTLLGTRKLHGHRTA